MRRENHLLEAVADADNLRLAFWKARNDKSNSPAVVQFQTNLEENLDRLRHQILDGEVVAGGYHIFKIFDPKERQICAPPIAQQVLHHALMNVCHPLFERQQVFDSYACRLGKGTHAALERARFFTRSGEWFLKLDVRKFFDSVHHPTLKNQLCRMFKDLAVLRIFEEIIESFETSPSRGLPIGNLTSQYFANHFLCGLDHFVKEKLQVKKYVRYMDDLVLWHPESQFLKTAFRQIQNFVQTELHCQLKPPQLNRTALGLPFLGYLIFPDRVWLSGNSRRRFVRQYVEIEQNFHSGDWHPAFCQRKILPLVAFTQHADAGAWRASVFKKTR